MRPQGSSLQAEPSDANRGVSCVYGIPSQSFTVGLSESNEQVSKNEIVTMDLHATSHHFHTTSFDGRSARQGFAEFYTRPSRYRQGQLSKIGPRVRENFVSLCFPRAHEGLFSDSRLTPIVTLVSKRLHNANLRAATQKTDCESGVKECEVAQQF